MKNKTMLSSNKYEDTKILRKTLQRINKLSKLLDQARAKQSTIRKSNFYFILGREQQRLDSQRVDLVVLRLEHRIKLLTKQLQL